MNILKQKALTYLEKMTAKTGTVLAVRTWEPASIIEIDLHLPGIAMAEWKQVQHMKIKVANGIYRDYSPALWDNETATCTLIIDAGHEGAGSKWAKELRKGDLITYLGIGPTAHKPLPADKIYCLGDASSIGHFLALEQLCIDKIPVAGTIALNNPDHSAQFARFFQTKLKTLVTSKKAINDDLTQLVYTTKLTNETVYMAGNIPLLSGLRKWIRQQDQFKGQVKLQGFWS